MTDELRFNPDGLGKRTEPVRFEVTRERLQQYAAATNDPIPAHRDGAIAGPVFAIVPVFHSLMEPVLEVVPPQLIGKIVHGEQDFRFHRPIRPGDVLLAQAEMTGWQALDKGTRACVAVATRTQDGELVNEQFVTFFVRDFVDGSPGDKRGELAPGHKFDDALRAPGPVAKVRQRVDEDQTYRYSEASGDPMPIHLDEEFAKSMGLPGIIAHGMCTMAFTSWAVLTEVARSDVTRLKRLAVRFAKPVLPGQELSTHIYRAGSADGVATYAYETAVGDELVITDGLAEVSEGA